MPPEFFRIDPLNPAANIANLRKHLGGAQGMRDLLADHMGDLLDDPRIQPRIKRVFDRMVPQIPGRSALQGLETGVRSGRQYASFGNLNVTAATVSFTLQTKRELKDVRLFFSDPTGILQSVTSLQVAGETVDMNFATFPAAPTGATSGSAGADLWPYRSQVLDFDPFTWGLPLGDISSAGSIIITLSTGWTAGTPYVGLGFNTTSKIAFTKLKIDANCGCD